MTGMNRSMPVVKHEPDDAAINPNQYMMAQQSYTSAPQQFTYSFNNHPGNQGIDPSDISMQNGNMGTQYGFGSQQNLSSSFNPGNAAIGDDELFEGLDFSNGQAGQSDQFGGQLPQQNSYHFQNQRHLTGISLSNQGQMTNVYSHTPDGLPIQSPLLGQFDYSQYKSQSQHMSPPHQGSLYEQNYQTIKRPSLGGVPRKPSGQKSPRTPAMHALHIGTPESGRSSSQPIRTGSLQRHQKTLSPHIDSGAGSYDSFDSPLSSPAHLSQHNGISEVLKSGSLPPKIGVPHGSNGGNDPDAKKKKRRDSHNLVERRRRDNINDRIQDLSRLVPQHRLDDDKVKKQLKDSSPMSANAGATSMSPPNASTAATSLLAGASGRRAASTAGNITIGLPIEEKEKGPNKGDILTGAVGWTRDLMWALYRKYMQDDELAQHIGQMGGVWPFEITEDERRMRSELMEAIDRNGGGEFKYSRGMGSGLRVPAHTDLAGAPISNNDAMSPQSLLDLSPGFHSGGSGTNSGSAAPGQPQYWGPSGHAAISFKEEDEDHYMEMT